MTIVLSTWQAPDDLLFLPLPGQLVLRGRTGIQLGPWDGRLVAAAATTILIRDVIYLQGRGQTLLRVPFVDLRQNADLQQVLGAPAPDLCPTPKEDESGLEVVLLYSRKPKLRRRSCMSFMHRLLLQGAVCEVLLFWPQGKLILLCGACKWHHSAPCLYSSVYYTLLILLPAFPVLTPEAVLRTGLLPQNYSVKQLKYRVNLQKRKL